MTLHFIARKKIVLSVLNLKNYCKLFIFAKQLVEIKAKFQEYNDPWGPE